MSVYKQRVNKKPTRTDSANRSTSSKPSKEGLKHLSPSFTADHILQLQRTIGNKGVTQLFHRLRQQHSSFAETTPLQRKIAISRQVQQPETEQTSVSSSEVVQRVIKVTEGDVTYSLEQACSEFLGTKDIQRKFKENDVSDESEQRIKLNQVLMILDGREFKSKRILQNKIYDGLKGLFTNKIKIDGPTIGGMIDSGKQFVSGVAPKVIEKFFGGKNRDPVYYKIGLFVKCKETEAVMGLLKYMELVAPKIDEGKIGRDGVEKTLDTLTAVWGEQPDVYTTDYETNKERSYLGGTLITLRGLIGELDRLYYSSLKDIGAGETVFSASVYSDKATNTKEDVDVSYIDSNNVLHLIECAADGNALKNKIAGNSDQKRRYQHLATQSSDIEHQPIDKLQGSQAEDRSVADVMFEYSIPESAFAKLVNNQEMLSKIARQLKSPYMSLLVGNETYTRDDLQQMLQ